MSFSLRNLFVLPVDYVLATSGSTQDLAAGEVGFFKEDYSVTDGTGTPKYIYIAQGRAENYLAGSKRSDKIAASKVKVWYKAAAEPTARLEIQEISNFTAKCGEDVTVTFRLHSSYIDTVAFNGLTRSVTVKAPCCDCGEDPCTDVDAEAIVDSIIEKINQEAALELDKAALKLSTYLTFEKVGTGGSTKLRITTKPLTKYGNPCDVAAFPWEYDRIWFRAFVYKGPETAADFIVADKCDPAGTVTVIQRSTYVKGSSDEVKQLEKDYHSYQSINKHLFRMVGYNQTFESQVVDGTFYDFYYIQFNQFETDLEYNPGIHMDEGILICVPSTGPNSGDSVETVLENFLGASADKSSPSQSTTTTTSTSTTTTTSTTTLIP